MVKCSNTTKQRALNTIIVLMAVFWDRIALHYNAKSGVEQKISSEEGVSDVFGSFELVARSLSIIMITLSPTFLQSVGCPRAAYNL